MKDKTNKKFSCDSLCFSSFLFFFFNWEKWMKNWKILWEKRDFSCKGRAWKRRKEER